MDVVERGKGRKKKKGVVTNIVIFEGETAINYDEPVRRWLCCYLFHRRGQRSERNALETIVHEEAETAGDPAFRAKAHKFAQMLYYQDDVAAERQKLEADRKALEVERQIIPMKFRMYNWGKPAPLAFTERVLRQESRIGLCTTFDKCIKGYSAKYMR
ncbi:unnamed protein product [Hydatigera taeniaeformis]|uniref:Uncharacterized protein n=1 Tax=Hydatigena taeniaeformis TaxID=6205 RepID=A0A0R3X2J9_HYDTA|nr:unnamed protein product [Hydatigera taeniaeformis]